ncbi:MAG: hypothetical protein AB2462_08975 [Thermoanaerobacter sp.]|uniref:hypothetical protein n=1 Tax=Thermoanaerobacter sp. TaxID=1755 RepID=UPI003464E39D
MKSLLTTYRGRRYLPCGRLVYSYNQSCRTECPHKTNEEIEECYKYHANILTKITRKNKKLRGGEINEHKTCNVAK